MRNLFHRLVEEWQKWLIQWQSLTAKKSSTLVRICSGTRRAGGSQTKEEAFGETRYVV